MALVGILVSSMFVMRIVTVFFVGAFSVPMIFAEVGMVSVSIVMPRIIMATTMHRTFVSILMAVVVIRFVLSSILMAIVA